MTNRFNRLVELVKGECLIFLKVSLCRRALAAVFSSWHIHTIEEIIFNELNDTSLLSDFSTFNMRAVFKIYIFVLTLGHFGREMNPHISFVVYCI